MSEVVSSQEVTHLWAHARQNYATNSGRTLFFRGDTIYSYGNHFPIARRLRHGIYAFTTGSYSMTTARHKSLVRQAIQHSAKVIYVTDPRMSADVADRRRVEHAIAELVASSARPRIKPATRQGLLAEATALADNFNAYAEAVGSTECVTFVGDQLAGMSIEQLRAHHDELVRQSREAELAEQRKRDAELADKVAAWKRGDDAVSSYDIRNASIALRLSYTELGKWRAPDVGGRDHWSVETSGGASIPVADAKRLWPVIQRVKRGERDYEVGMSLGGYTLTKIRRDGSIIVGCHDIAYSEIERIAELLGLIESEVPA